MAMHIAAAKKMGFSLFKRPRNMGMTTPPIPTEIIFRAEIEPATPGSPVNSTRPAVKKLFSTMLAPKAPNMMIEMIHTYLFLSTTLKYLAMGSLASDSPPG
jgi:hypothetical protein